MAQPLNDYLNGRACKGFKPRPHYIGAADYVRFFFNDAFAYEERVDELLTVYRSAETGELVGCKIKGVKRLLKEAGSFGVLIKDGSLQLGLLFMAASQANPKSRTVYQELGRRASGVELDARELQLAA